MLEGMTCDKLARFFNNNLCDLPEDLAQFCGDDAYMGFLEIQSFLRNVYSGYREYLENGVSAREYMQTVETACSVLFAFACLCNNKESNEQRISRADFLKLKRVDLSSVISLFDRYGISICYYKGTETVKYFKASTSISVTFSDKCIHMPSAFAYVRRGFVTVRSDVEYTDVLSMFGKLDVARLLSSKKRPKNNFNIFRDDILRCTGKKEELYRKLVSALAGRNCSHSCTYISTNVQDGPAWSIEFFDDDTACVRLCIVDECIVVKLPIPKVYLKQTVMSRGNYSKAVKEKIDGFCCLACGRCQRDGRDYMRFIDNVPCCFGMAEASEIVFSLTSQEEIDDVTSILSSFAPVSS